MQPKDVLQMGNPFAIEGILNSRPSRQGLKELNALERKGIRCYPKRPLSYSSLKEFKKSPLSYIEYVTKPRTFTAATSHGKLFEDLLFGRSPKERFVIFERPEPNRDFRIKANKQAKDQAFAQASAEGKEAIERPDFERIQKIALTAFDHPFMKRARKSKTLKHPKQKTIREPNTGLKLTGIPDLEYNRGKIGVDIKFGESVAEWEKRIFNRQYAMWMQAAMYGIIYGYKEFYFFCTQSKNFTYSQAFHIDAQSMEVLKDHLIENVLRKFRRQLGIGFFKDAEEVEIPDWMLYTAA